MKKIYYITAVFATLFLVGCGDGIDLPGVNVETDLNKIPLPDNNVNRNRKFHLGLFVLMFHYYSNLSSAR